MPKRRYRDHYYNGDEDVANLKSNQEFVKCVTHGFHCDHKNKKFGYSDIVVLCVNVHLLPKTMSHSEQSTQPMTKFSTSDDKIGPLILNYIIVNSHDKN